MPTNKVDAIRLLGSRAWNVARIHRQRRKPLQVFPNARQHRNHSAAMEGTDQH